MLALILELVPLRILPISALDDRVFCPERESVLHAFPFHL